MISTRGEIIWPARAAGVRPHLQAAYPSNRGRGTNLIEALAGPRLQKVPPLRVPARFSFLPPP
jgi:hypothetical protein